MDHGGHRLADERSRALHREVARRLRLDPALLGRARARVAAWLADGSVAREYAEAWREILDGPRERLLALLDEDSPRARDLRQSTPFAGVVPPRERWRIWRGIRERPGSAG